MPQLIYNLGLADERVFRVAEGETAIGRAIECEICIVHRSLSRRHALIDHADGRSTLRDLESKNGTFVNEVKIDHRDLRPGDVIKVGDVVLVFAADGGPRPGPRRPALRRDSAFDEPLSVAQPTLVRDLTHLAFEDLLLGRQGAASRAEDREAATRAQGRLQILLEVSRLLASPTGVDALLDQVLGLVFKALDVDRGAILLLDRETGRLAPRIARSKAATDGGPGYSQRIVDYVYTNSVAAVFCDAAIDPRLDVSGSVLHQSIRSSMGVPLRPKDHTIGVLYVDNRSAPNSYTEADLEFLAAFANQAAIVIENATLYRRIEEETVTRMRLIMEAKLASLGAVVSGIAHEIKNPLNFISNFAEISAEFARDLTGLLAAPRDDPETRAEIEEILRMLQENAGKIVEHGQRAKGIIDGMLRHARGTSGVRVRGDLNAILAESLRVALATAGAAGIHVDADYDGAIGSVEMVSEDLSRVFMSLIQNACHAMRQKEREAGPSYAPSLGLRTIDRGDRVEVCIRDNGTGIPPQIADKIFNPFFTTKPPGAGTGLGLSIAHDIVVEGHQGSVQMSTVPGEFAEFVVSLPKRTLPPSTTP